KTKRVLIVVIVLLALLIGALAYFTYMLVEEAQRQAVQQTLEHQPADVDALKDNEPSDASSSSTKTTDVPNLVELIGKKQDDAVTLIGHGATVVSSAPANEEGSPIKTEAKVSLTDEPSDTRSGTPTVYLGLDGAGIVVRAGYSAATTSLGFGTSSFVDAVTKDNIIEKTLNEAGTDIALGSVTLPDDKSEYTTYKSDDKTVVQESYSFSGNVQVNGADCEWSAVLRYDYTAEIASGNLADTIRQIYIYLYVPSAATPADQLPATPAATTTGQTTAGQTAGTPAATTP
ncbi:MAG: hypothetical protein FWD72_06495, partial [Eggerthellaceae bacterium]|nr:hypothetical protein [Eggerthellaceae bacterium]